MICEKTVGSSHVQVLIINWLNLSTMLSKIIIILIIEWYGAINKFQAMPFHLLACFFIELEDNTGDVMLHDNANSLLVTPCLININGKKTTFEFKEQTFLQKPRRNHKFLSAKGADRK